MILGRYLGDVSPSAAGSAALITGAASGIATGIATGSPLRGAGAAVGGVLTTIAPLTGPAAPFVAAVGVAVSLISNMFHGCGVTCVQATQIANAFEDQFNQLKAQYFATTPRYKSMQTAYLTAFDQLAAQMKQACSNPALGSAGQRCISERLVQGGTAPWCPNAAHTGCDWITTYRDPIANDNQVVADPSPVSDIVSSFLGPDASTAGGFSIGWLALGLIVAGVLM